MINTIKDLLMVLLYAKGKSYICDPIIGRTHLMKTMFLFVKEATKYLTCESDQICSVAYPRFEASDYGPFSNQVWEAVNSLVFMGMVEIDMLSSVELSDDEIYENHCWEDFNYECEFAAQFSLTELGRTYTEKQIKPTDAQVDVLSKLKISCNELPMSNLLKYISIRYPSYRTNKRDNND